jgi:flagellar motility protein MotE (MotC chaperone)
MKKRQTSLRIKVLICAAAALVLLKVFYAGWFMLRDERVSLSDVINTNVSAQEDNRTDPASAVDPAATAVTAQETISNAEGGDFEWNYELIMSLRDKQRALNEREDMLDKKEDRLRALEKHIESRIKKLDELESRIVELIEQKKAVENEKVRKLAKVFEATPPEQAGPLLSELDVDIAAQLILQMQGRKAGRIWGYVTPRKAVKISEELARIKPGYSMENIEQQQ